MKKFRILAMVMAICTFFTLVACTKDEQVGEQSDTDQITETEKTTEKTESDTTADSGNEEGDDTSGGEDVGDTTPAPKYSWSTQGGDGTEASPLIINQTNFVEFYNYYVYGGWNGFADEDEYFKLGSDIVVNEGDAKAWATTAPSVKFTNALADFRGIFDGDNHTISGLYVKTDAGATNFVNAALFNSITSAGVVKNVRIVNSYFEITNSKHSAAASIAGQLNGGLIENCYSEAILYTGDNNTSVELGGIVGMTNATNSRISNCVFAGIVEGENCLNAGGIVGKANTGDTLTCTITNCLNLGVVKAKICGAIIGASATNGSTEITNSFNLSKQVFKITANGDKEWNYLCGHGAYKANVASNMKITTYAIVEFSTKDYVYGDEDVVKADVNPNYYGVVHSVIAGEESKINISHITLQEFLTKLKAGEVAGWTVKDGYVPTPIADLQIDISTYLTQWGITLN